MANRQQLNILKKGYKLGLTWRSENPDVGIDLRGAKLNSTDLAGIWLDDADLSNANLTGVDLSEPFSQERQHLLSRLPLDYLSGPRFHFGPTPCCDVYPTDGLINIKEGT